jgi:hypothetical protein
VVLGRNGLVDRWRIKIDIRSGQALCKSRCVVSEILTLTIVLLRVIECLTLLRELRVRSEMGWVDGRCVARR